MTTVADLYTQILGRAPDAGGLEYWTQQFGSNVDPSEASLFTSVAQQIEPERVAATAAAANTSSSSSLWNQIDPSSSISAEMAAATPITVEDLYNKFYGTVDPAGAAYWKQQFGATVDPVEQAKFIKEVGNYNPEISTGVTVDQAYKTYLGNNTDQAGMDYWKQRFGTGSLTADQLSEITNAHYGLNDSGGGLFGGGGFLGTGLKTSDIAKAAALYYGGSALADALGASGLEGVTAEQLAAANATEDPLAALNAIKGWTTADLGYLASIGGMTPEILAAATANNAYLAGGAADAGLLTPAAATTVGSGAADAAAAAAAGTGGLTATQLGTLAKAGLTTAGLLGGTKALTNLVGGTGGTGGLTLPTQDRSGVSSGSAQYSPEYYQAIQAKYNQLLPQQPRDVTTELKNWYETKYAPTATITPTIPKVA